MPNTSDSVEDALATLRLYLVGRTWDREPALPDQSREALRQEFAAGIVAAHVLMLAGFDAGVAAARMYDVEYARAELEALAGKE